MSKVTTAGWPDPNDWIYRLHHSMVQRHAAYEAEPDIELKRNKAAAMLAEVLFALQELPPFLNSNAHLPLKDLLIFISDLERGRKHPWSAPVNVGGTNISTTSQSELKTYVRGVFNILCSVGFKKTEAQKRIAIGLSANGRTRRGGEPIRWQRVREWCLEQEAPRDQMIYNKLLLWWDQFRSSNPDSEAGSNGRPATEKELAGMFADKAWAMPHLRDCSISGVSE